MNSLRGFVRKTGKRMLQRTLIHVAGRHNYYVTRGTLHRLDATRLIKGDWGTSVDMVRNATVELLSREIYAKGISGAIAEVGVYQGEFAAILNDYFPDRRLYLFDTFGGFDSRDAEYDRSQGLSPASWDFSDTSVDLVLSKMPHRDQVIVKAGYFPESAAGCEAERFCLVSLDPDLYQPTYAGLCWFYPRLADGGYIVVNDYDNSHYSGVKEAVADFARSQAIGIVPIPDVAGSMVIAKPRMEPR
jgi:O-methyltransferase